MITRSFTHYRAYEHFDDVDVCEEFGGNKGEGIGCW